MGDIIGIAIIGLQYFFSILAVKQYLGVELPLEAEIGILLAYAGVGVAVWHRKKEWQSAVATWAKLTLGSLIMGIGFVGVDSLLGYSEGAKPVFTGGGLLGFPLTVLICPPFTMICVAGLVRAFYLRRAEATQARKESPASTDR
jgi:hypothetical protein